MREHSQGWERPKSGRMTEAKANLREGRCHASHSGLGRNADKKKPMIRRTVKTRSNPRERGRHASYSGLRGDAKRSLTRGSKT